MNTKPNSAEMSNDVPQLFQAPRTLEERLAGRAHENPFGAWSLVGALAFVFGMTMGVSAFAQGAEPKPVAFEQLVARMATELKECDPLIDEIDTITGAQNVQRGPRKANYLSLKGANKPINGDVGPLLRPATPEQIKSLVGKKFCMVSN